MVVDSARNVVMLKKRVPTSCTTELHQSMRCGSQANQRTRCPVEAGELWSVRKVSRSCSAAAAVNKREPTKKTTASVSGPTRLRNAGIGPTTVSYTHLTLPTIYSV